MGDYHLHKCLLVPCKLFVYRIPPARNDYRIITLLRGTRDNTGYDLLAADLRLALPTLLISVYDVANRESFDVLPRWYRELETYVRNSVVRILVGNKSNIPLLVSRLSPLIHQSQEFSCQVSTKEDKPS